MTCSRLFRHTWKSRRRREGVTSCQVSLLTNSMSVEFEDKSLEEKIIKAVEDAGYGVSAAGTSAPAAKRKGAEKDGTGLPALLFSVAVLVLLMYIGMGHMIGLPLPSFFTGTENRRQFCVRAAPAHAARRDHLQEIFYQRLSEPRKTRAQYGYAHRGERHGVAPLRRGCDIHHELQPRRGGSGGGRGLETELSRRRGQVPTSALF